MDRPSRSNPLSELVGEFPGRLRGDRWQPAVDVFETEKAVVVRVELSGVRSSQVKVHLGGMESRKGRPAFCGFLEVVSRHLRYIPLIIGYCHYLVGCGRITFI